MVRKAAAIYCGVPIRKKSSKTESVSNAGNTSARNLSGGKSSAGHPLDLGPDENGVARRVRSTTVICIRRGNSMVMAADGQVTLGSTVMKHSRQKDPAAL